MLGTICFKFAKYKHCGGIKKIVLYQVKGKSKKTQVSRSLISKEK